MSVHRARTGGTSCRERPVKRGRALLLSAIAGALFTAFPLAAPAAEESTGRQVRMAILRAVEHLKRSRKTDGTWPDYAREGGVTALICYALVQAGVAPDDEAVAAGLETLRKTPNEATYVVALKAMAFSAANPVRFREEIQASADWLAQTQQATGGWGYGLVPEAERAGAAMARGWRRVQDEAQLQSIYQRTDASNTQFAVLGLAEAQRAGAHVPADVWRKADRHFRATQLPGGGWGYIYQKPDPNEAYGSMTAAAVASLFLCAERLAPQETSETRAERSRIIEQGIEWIAQRYSLRENPGRGAAWYYFWLYSLERAGVTSGQRTFGTHDWFREGTAVLVSGQKADGSWSSGHLYEDALGLLFLAKGYKPLLVQRLEWPGAWRRDPRDLEHLVAFLGTRVGGPGAPGVAWRTLAPQSPIEDWLAAPILHVTGRGALEMLAADLPKVRQYVEQGGLILFDPEGGDKAFADSARRLAGDLWPGATMEPLPSNHPIYAAMHSVPAAGLESLRLGCRAAVLLAPNGLADGWAAGDPDRPNDALRLGENLAVYATGNNALPDRLAEARLLQMPADEPPPRGALRIGQVQHNGDWQPRPFALPALLEQLPKAQGVSVWSRPVPIRLAEADLGEFPVLYMVGHYSFTLAPEEREALKAYLDRGGFLFAEACCGREAFDQAFRALMADLFPDSPLEELPADHPIYSGTVGTKIDRVAYAPAVQAESPGLDRPALFGLKRDGHTVVIYSPYGIGVGLDGLRTWGARCLEPDDAKRLATNILLYALSN